MAFQRKKPGDSGPIPAADWNAMLDAAEKVNGGAQLGGGKLSYPIATTIVDIRNDSGSDVAAFGVLGIDAPFFLPVNSDPESVMDFLNGVAFSCVEPAEADHKRGRTVITLEPIKDGAVGKAIVAGAAVGVVKIKTDDAGDPDDVETADLHDADNTHLIPAAGGAWRVLWIQSVSDAGGTGNDRWAIVATAGGGATAQRMRVKSISDDYLTCRTWDGTTEGDDDIIVAKPWEMQKTAWSGTTKDGVTYHYYTAEIRRATGTGFVIDERPNEKYFVDCEITATRPIGGTGVSVGDVPVEWQDDNRAARHWVPRPYLLTHCTNASELKASGNLHDSIGSVVSLAGDNTNCWTVSEADGPAGALIELGATYADCNECATRCWLLKQCADDSITEIRQGTYNVGDVVLIDDDCYTVDSEVACPGGEETTQLIPFADCNACDTCFVLEECPGGTDDTITVRGPAWTALAARVTAGGVDANLTWQNAGKCYRIPPLAEAISCPDGTAVTTPDPAQVFADCETCLTSVNCVDCVGMTWITATGTGESEAAAQEDALNELRAIIDAACTDRGRNECNYVAGTDADPVLGVYTVQSSMCFKCCCPEGSKQVEVIVTPLTCNSDGTLSYDTEFVCTAGCGTAT